ncbi:MAG TPA: cysteine--tRNA ligase, partial [bacterium]|nr:cysteine--tRNA ligase [bacterium]
KKVRMYVCGITPYDETHLGHGRSYVFFDSLRRFLEFSGYEVRYVQNFTDIDDKIISKSREEKITPKEVADKYIGSYRDVIRKLGIRDPDFSPRVTDHIPEIIEGVRLLMEKGFAYRISDGIYYDIGKFPGYGKLSGKTLEDLIEGARIEPNPEKLHPGDFALWKFAGPQDTGWDFSLGRGRPGWHIECSVMSRKYLGDTMDIHGGGQDLIFPHHENEIAQSEALTGRPLANYWLHNGFLVINKEKMSKSLKNFFNLKDLFAEGFSPRGMRFFLLKEHWRRPLDFTIEKLREAELKMQDTAEKIGEIRKISKAAPLSVSPVSGEILNDIRNEFTAALEDDFNTPKAFAQFFRLVSFIEGKLYQDVAAVSRGSMLISEMDSILGLLDLEGMEKKQALPEEEIERLVRERGEAKTRKDFKRADEIRNQLKDKGILLEDTPAGTRWKLI